MDGTRFNALTRGLGSVVDHRTTTQAVVGSALGALGLTAGHDVDAKKKKCQKPRIKCGTKCCTASQVCANGKCAAACQFTKAATSWKLKGNCTTTRAITVPDGVTLDGNGKTIKLAGLTNSSGSKAKFFLVTESGASSAGIRHLILDGSGLTDAAACDAFNFAALLFSASGEIDDVTITDLPCGSAIIVARGDGPPFTIKNSMIENVDLGLFVNVGAVTADANTFRNVSSALAVIASGDPASLIATDNTIVGRGSSVPGAVGVFFGEDATGEVSGNAISNFLGSSAGTAACGIRIAENAGVVTIGTNTLTDPPGNEQNVCDLRN